MDEGLALCPEAGQAPAFSPRVEYGAPVVCQNVVAMPLGAGARLSEFKSSHPCSGKLPNLSGPQLSHL